MTVVSVELRSTSGNVCESRGRLSGSAPAQPVSTTDRSAARQELASELGRMRLRPCGMRGREDRHLDAEVRAGILPIDDLDGAAMRIDELEHDRQADSRALH